MHEVICVHPVAAVGRLSHRLKFVTAGEAASVKPADDRVYQLWLRGCRAVIRAE